MASDIQKNSFDGSMNQDLSKTSLPANKYYRALNFRITTNKGLSTTALENIKGNLDLVTIPDTSEVKQLTMNYNSLGSSIITISNGTTSGTSVSPFITSTGTTALDLYNHLNNDPGFNTVKTLYKIYYNNNAVLFYGLDPDDVFTITDVSGGIIVTDNFVPKQLALETIGSTFINDDIYLLTTNNTTKSPGKDDPSSYGQIWKIVINDEDNTASIELIYNNQLNFSTYNAFSPTSILGRYENQNVQRIYFTDFFNRIRTLNVADPQAFATELSLLYITPSVKFDVPILKKLELGGTNLVGSYQLAYRLVKTSGAVTAYSEPSDLVNLVTADENTATNGANFVNYIGNPQGDPANKIITWQINNIDTSFDRIECVIIIRYTETRTATSVLAKFADLPIESDGSMIIKFVGTETLTPITLNDLLITYENFAFAKTLTTKDNRLIIGNVKSTIDGLSNFDARAYRSKDINSETIYLTNNGVESLNNLTTLYDPNLNPENRDNINNYSGANAGKYKPNTSKLGGEGKFISYEFGTFSTMCDFLDSFADFQGVPGLRHTTQNYNYPDTINLGIQGQDHDQNQINDGLKYAYKSNLLKGYQRDEIYRFGIQFYDKSGNPYFVKWIGDIKFPTYFDKNDNPDQCAMQNGINDFRLIFYDSVSPGVPRYYLQQMYIKFKINLPADLAAVVGYYNIVRVERLREEKTVLGSGLIFPTAYSSSNGTYYAGLEGNVADTQPTGIPDFNVINFQIPEFLFAGLYATGQASVKLEANVIATNMTPTEFKPDLTTPAGGGFGVFKMYDFQPNSQPDRLNVVPGYIQRVNTADTVLLAPYDFSNYQNFFDGVQWVGTDTVVAKLDGQFNSASYIANPNLLYFGTYRRILEKQYGGNTYSQRSMNVYISCNNVQSVVGQGPFSFESKVFGGDTFVGLMDNERCIRNIGTDGITQPSSHEIYSRIYLFPCESSMNTELRYGGHANKDLVDSGAVAWDYHEDYFYNAAFKNENNIKKYYPKPDPFLENNEFINRFYASEIKINGELTDSWSQFKSLNYYDVEGSYGPINGVSVLQDEVYYIQDKAFGKLSINPKEVLTTKEGSSVGLGRGNILDSHEYISTEIGSKHQFSFIKSSYQLFFVDSRHKKIYSFAQNKPLNPISDLQGMYSWMFNNFNGRIENTDKPVYEGEEGLNGVHGVYDYINNELIYTFSRSRGTGVDLITDKDTFAYNPLLEAFTSFYSHTPKIYVTNNKKFISADITDTTDLNMLFLHNHGDYGRFYRVYKNSEIEVYSNKHPEVTKVFDNLMFETEVQDGTTLIDTDSGVTPIHETFNTLQVSSDYQGSDVITLNSSNTSRNYRTWRTPVPKSNVQAAYVSAGLFARMRDKYLKIKFSFLNNNNKRFIVHNILTFFRLNQPK